MFNKCLSFVGLVSFVSFAAAAPPSSVPQTAQEMGLMVGSPPKKTIDIAKWDKGPYNRWAFQHMSEIVPTAVISRGMQPRTEFVSAPVESITQLKFTTLDDQELTVEENLKLNYTDSFIVLKGGKVVLEKYYNGMGPETRHLLMSVSKSVTGAVIGSLIEAGELSPDNKVVDYIPELKNSPGFKDATVRQILDMTTAIQFSEDYADPNAEVVKHEEATAWRGQTSTAKDGLYAFAQEIQRVERNHGEVFHYASINTDILGWLIERATGERFSDYMSNIVWSKLGAERDALLSVDLLGSPVVNGGFVMTTRDLARFGQMILQGGHFNGQQIVPKEWIEDIRMNGNNAAWKPTSYSKIWPDGFYRSQWYVTKDDQGSFFGVGVNGQHLWINPTTNVVIVKFSSYPISADVKRGKQDWAMMDAIARSLK
ncbi:serine hydrolase domain-containing protein [Microbulbifer agarilyticus]|uniref:serine hydrolase domain-containing protein n=1 Tax=Microbulbifer agarilyticus TaxID=260552 RepID=UPI001CD54B01|nr:serine hydrolase [Microbulbifer agarilyticus]MCA0900515.1 beta-lactamase family protein [Microbulbifer agarilyticus]